MPNFWETKEDPEYYDDCESSWDQDLDEGNLNEQTRVLVQTTGTV